MLIQHFLLLCEVLEFIEDIHNCIVMYFEFRIERFEIVLIMLSEVKGQWLIDFSFHFLDWLKDELLRHVRYLIVFVAQTSIVGLVR